MGRRSVREVRRAELTAAFARVLAHHGYAGATIAAVAEEAGVAPGLVHHHFKGKADLLESLLEHLVAAFRKRTAGKEQGEASLAAWLAAAVELGDGAEPDAARCWVGVLAEAVRAPEFGAKVRRLVDTEIEGIQRRSRRRLGPQDAAALLAFVLGALVMGAFAPRRTAGFAGPAARKLLRAFG